MILRPCRGANVMILSSVGLCDQYPMTGISEAFFRQLGGPPPTLDGMGNPSRRLSGDELREMRAARMQV